MKWKPGDTIQIPVNVKPGPFERERLVSFETTDGPVSGFVPSDRIIEKGDGKFIEAKVVGEADDTITVNLAGSFFTTTGLAHFSKRRHLQVAA